MEETKHLAPPTAYAQTLPYQEASTTIALKIKAAAEVRGLSAPLAFNVAWCESLLQQFNADGSLFRGVVNRNDVGLFQINEHYHLQSASRAGFDVETTDGNISYALDLMKAQGTQPWEASKDCWSKTPPTWTKAVDSK